MKYISLVYTYLKTEFLLNVMILQTYLTNVFHGSLTSLSHKSEQLGVKYFEAQAAAQNFIVSISLKEKYKQFVHTFTKEKNMSIKRRKNLYVFSMILLFVMIVGKQALILYMMKSQKAEAQFITHLSHQRIVCTEIVKSVYQYNSNMNIDAKLSEKVNVWHEINMALLAGNKDLGIPEPKISAAYISLGIEMLSNENELLKGFEMLKSAQYNEGLKQILAAEGKYMAVLEKMLKLKGSDAGKNYGLISIMQMLSDVFVLIILLSNFLFIMLPFIGILIKKNTELQVSQEKMGAVLESISDMKFLLDKEANVVLINKTAKAGISFLTEKVLEANDNILALIAPNKEGEFYEAFFKALTGNIMTIEKSFMKNNITYWYKVEFQPVWNHDNIVTNVTLSFIDISAIKNAQIALEHQNKDLQEIAHIQSHELRGPLASIMGLVALFDDKYPEDSFNKDIIKNLKISSEKLDAVIFQIVAKAEKIDQESSKNQG